MGFDVNTPVYHGTTANIKNIDPNKFGKSTETSSGNTGFWTTDKPYTASSFANYAAYHSPANRLNLDAQQIRSNLPNRRQNIMPLYLNKSNMSTMDAKGQSWSDVMDNPELDEKVRNFLETASEKGRVGEIKNFDDVAAYMSPEVATHYVATSPSDVRSVNAAFDPFRRNEPDILAGVAAAPAGMLAVDKQQNKEKSKK